MSRFVQVDRDTAYLLPPSVQDWLPQDHLARFIVDTVEQLDLSELNRQYAGRGEAAYPPAMLLALLFYGYATGEFASRRIERASFDSVAFRFIAGNTHPDHDTIAAFRKRFLPQLKALFIQILQVAQALKLLKVGNVSLDGSKFKANASKHKALSYGHAKKLEEQFKAEVEQLLRMAEQADRKPLPEGLDVPAQIARREDRLSAIAAAKAQIEARAKVRHDGELKAFQANSEPVPVWWTPRSTKSVIHGRPVRPSPRTNRTGRRWVTRCHSLQRCPLSLSLTPLASGARILPV